jgi:hypothetical protein
MNRFVLGLMAASLLAAAVPAAAQSYGPAAPPSYGGGYDDRVDLGYGRGDYGYGRDGDRRDDFRAQIERLSNHVRREADEGDLTQWQARRLFGEIGDLRQLERRYRYSGGFLDRRERFELNARLDQLRGEVRAFHGAQGYGGRYGPEGYGGSEDYWSQDRGDRGPR